MRWFSFVFPLLVLASCLPSGGLELLKPVGERVLLPVKLEWRGDPPFDVYVDGDLIESGYAEYSIVIDDLGIGEHFWKVVSGNITRSATFEVIEADSTLVIHVTSSTSGPPVPGATVTVSGFSTLTDDEGIAVLNIRTPRKFVNVHVKKYGYARSDVINLPIVLSGSREYRVLLRKPNLSLDPEAEEMISVVADFFDSNGEELDFDSVSGTFTVIATATSERPIHYFYGALGKIPGADYMTGPRVLIEDSETFSATFNTAGFSGYTEFHLVVYDYNENRVDVIFPMNISSTEGWIGNFYIPVKEKLVSYTVSPEIIFYAAPENSNLWVELGWIGWEESESSPTTLRPDGYSVYRSFDGKIYDRIGFVPLGKNLYRDHSPKLKPGKRVSYRVCSNYSGSNGRCVDFGSVVPLDSFRVELLYPEDGAKDVPRNPTFRASGNVLESPEGAVRYVYSIALWDEVFSDSVLVEATESDGKLYLLLRESTSPDFVLSFDDGDWYYFDPNDFDFKEYEWDRLEGNKTYEWGFVQAHAYVEDDDSIALSLYTDLIYLGLPATFHNRFTTEGGP